MGRRAKTEEHNFYCIKCGNRGIPLSRKVGRQHENFHRKKLFCVFCGQEVNHIECKTMEDVEQFKINYKMGVYKDEAEESVSYVRSVWKWKDDLG